MTNHPLSGNVVTAFLNEGGKSCLLLGSVTNRLRDEPGSAASLLGDNLVHQL